MIREITKEEIPTLVQLHLKILPGSIQAKFGSKFVHLFYESLLPDSEFFCDGFFWDSHIVGFTTYSPRPWKAFHRALRRKFWAFLGVLFLSIARHPQRLALLARLVPTFFRWRHEPGEEVEAEGINWGVLPEYRRSSQFYKQTGVHVAMQMLLRMMGALKKQGVRRLKIMPNAGDPATLKFLRNDHWEFAGQLNRFGEMLDVYIKDLHGTDKPNQPKELKVLST